MISAIKSSWRGYPALADWLVPWGMLASALAVPISSTARSILIPLSIGLIILTPTYRRDVLATLSETWCIASLLLFFMVLMGCSLSPANLHEKMLFIEKYSKLLYLPFLVVGFRDPKIRQMGLYGFIFAMLITFCVSILKATGLLQYHTADPGDVFHNHILTGYMMALATYVAALFFVRQPGKIRILYGLLVVAFSFQLLFLNQGRTGYVAYLLSMIVLMTQVLSFRKALLAIVMGCLLFAALFTQSQSMQNGAKQVISDWRVYHQNSKNTPIGYRLQFHEYAKRLYLRHPWIGNGTASFTHIYHEEAPIPSWSRTLLEPHSQYWLIAVEFGLLGIMAYFFFIGSLFMACLRLKAMRAIGLALFVPFVCGCATDSLLLYSSSGFFFLFFMALCLGEQQTLMTLHPPQTRQCNRDGNF